MDRSLVITGIDGITEAINDCHELGDWDIILLCDKKSPSLDDSSYDRLTYLGPAQQEELNFELVEHLPYNHYCRKNIGYLWTIERGYNLIGETDDDNFPKDE